MNNITKEMRDELRAPLPPEAISKHPTKPDLSSLKSIYVTERLSDVFGIGGWTFQSEIIDANNGAPVVRVKLQIPEYNINLEQFGGNDNGGVESKNYDLGDAYKGAVTDAITKICSYLEIGIHVFKGIQTGSGGNRSGSSLKGLCALSQKRRPDMPGGIGKNHKPNARTCPVQVPARPKS